MEYVDDDTSGRLWRLSVAFGSDLLDFWCHGCGFKESRFVGLSRKGQKSHTKSKHWHPMVDFPWIVMPFPVLFFMFVDVFF